MTHIFNISFNLSDYSVVLYLLLLIIKTNRMGKTKVNIVTTINKIPSSEKSAVVWISPLTLSLTSLVTTNISFKYFVNKALAESARFVNEAKTAKKVALR